MKKLLETENRRMLDIFYSLAKHSDFDAYLEQLKNIVDLPYLEAKYYLEQIKDTISSYDEPYWDNELKAVEKVILLLDKFELLKIEKEKQDEPIRLFWNSFKLWVTEDLPALKILHDYYTEYNNWNGGTYYLNINMSTEFTKAYGLPYDDRYEKNTISLLDLKLYLELFYRQFVKDRYNFTTEVNRRLQQFKLPYRLSSGKFIKKGYKTSESNLPIINFPMLESKILWSEDKILCPEKLDKHTALNYITDSLEYIFSIIDKNDQSKKTLEQLSALLVCADENSKVYAVIKNEVKEIQKIVNEYFDIRHNEYLNKAKENREPLNNSIFIEYLYNRIYALLFILKMHVAK